MRFGLLAAAAAMVCAVPASAATVSGIFESNTGILTITGGSKTTCPLSGQQTLCSTSTPSLNSFFPSPAITFDDANGTTNFSGMDGPSSNAGVYSFTGNVVFQNGDLISDLLTFEFNSEQIGSSPNGVAVMTTVTGNIRNALLTVFDGNTVRTVEAVPEPATWAMMILGMGAVGFAMRSAKRRSDEKFDAKIKRITYGAAV